MENKDKKEIVRIVCLMGGLILVSSIFINAHGHEMSLGYLPETIISIILGIYGLVKASGLIFKRKIINFYTALLFILSLLFITGFLVVDITQELSKLIYIN